MSSDDQSEEEVLPSRTEERAERKKVQSGLDALAKRLAGLSPKALDALELDGELVDAVRTLARLPNGRAFARQRRHVARSLRAYDTTAITRRIDEVLGNRGLDARSQSLERWRSRLLEEGDGALAELVAQHPAIDSQRIRQAVRAAATEEKKGPRGRRFKALYQILSEAIR